MSTYLALKTRFTSRSSAPGRLYRALFWVVLLLNLAGCGGKGAVVFAPTPLPLDIAPRRYDHPGGAFSISIPPHWTLYEQNTEILAAAAFALPDTDETVIDMGVINLQVSESVPDLLSIINISGRGDKDVERI